MTGKTAFLIPPLALLGACQTVDEIPAQRLGHATIRTADGTLAGTAQLLQAGNQVNVVIAAAGLPEGTRGTHLHMAGACQAPDFSSAGGHLNPAAHQHGTDNAAGAHFGDLPNLTAGASGGGTMTATLQGTPQQVADVLFDNDGTAIVIHAQPDDYRTDPSGNSGSRIACGVLVRD